MNFNLSALEEAVNSKFENQSPKPVTFNLTKDSDILVYFGNVAYFFDYQKLQEVLEANKFDQYYKEETQELITELLSKHIVNQVTASFGKKVYPEIVSVKSDHNQWD